MALISIDNGLTYHHAPEVINAIVDDNLWEIVVNAMDDTIREQVHMELAPCSELEFLSRYLKLAENNLVIG